MMMAIKKRRTIMDIFDDYFEDFEREFERRREMLLERPSWNQKNSTIEPLRNMIVTPTEVIVTVDLPLTEEKAVQVKPLDENTLEISARMKRKMTFREMGMTHQEGEFQKFHFHSRVPVPVQMDEMKIRFKKGILEVHLPRKRGRRKPKT
jgi:HSP20 family molecular chaperone IbpA